MSDGFVYLFARGDLHKIGASASPRQRLLTAAKGGTVVHLIPSAARYKVEAALLRRFAAQREGPGKEWFRLSGEDVAAILALGRVDTPDELPENLRPPGGTETVRVAADIMEMLRQIRFHTRDHRGKRPTLTALLDSMLRPVVKQALAELRARRVVH